LMGEPLSAVELDILQFIEKDVPRLPPRIFEVRPDAAQWLLRSQPMVQAVRDAARQPVCRFPDRGPDSPFVDTMHLKALEVLTARVLATAKTYEYVENLAGSATIYRDLLVMVQQLDQESSLRSGLTAAALLQQVVYELEGLLVRNPVSDTVEPLRPLFEPADFKVFHLGRYLRVEGERVGRWILAGPEGGLSRLNRLYGRANVKPAVDRLITLSNDDRQRRLREWVMDYEAHMIRLSEVVDWSYRDAVSELRRMDKELAKLKKHVPAGANPLLPLLVPEVTEAYERFVLAEAQFRMIGIMVRATAYRAEDGRWPVSLKECAGRRPPAWFTDPFSQKPFYYKLVHVMPRVATRVPRWMADKERKLLYILDAYRRIQEDDEAFEEAEPVQRQRLMALQQQLQANEDVPRE
jgi:hypothetical protein